MKQILVIHGGNAFETYEEYINDLKTKDLTLARIRMVGWKKNLAHDLGQDYDVLTPIMPNAQNSRYSEWKIWFEKIINLMDEEIMLVGHSLGGIFITKYLSENILSKKIKATFLVGSPYNTPLEHPLVDFNITTDLSNFAKQSEQIFIYHSKDDKVVPYSNCERYAKELPETKVRTFENLGHFQLENFPEIVQDIKSIN